MTQRVKVSRQEALSESARAVEQERTSKANSTRKKAKAKQQRRKKRHPNDAKTEQDMDAIVGFDDSSSEEMDQDIDTNGDTGFVMVNSESELEELEELSLVATEEGFSSVRVGVAQQKKKKKRTNKAQKQETSVDMSKETKKMKQARKLLETMDIAKAEKVAAGAQKRKKESEKAHIATAATGNVAQGKTKAEKGKNIVKGGIPTRNEKKKKKDIAKVNCQVHMEEERAATLSSRTDKRSKASYRTDGCQVRYAEYLDHDVVIRALETGSLFQGKLRVNPMYRMDGYVTVDGLLMDVVIKGMQDRNRALDGDLVAIRLHPEAAWEAANKDNKRRAIGGAQSAPMSSSAGVDQNALHSLWLPNVQTDQCFLKRPPEEDDTVDMLEETRARLNERIKDSHCRPTATVVFVLAKGNANGFVGSLEAKTKVKGMNVPLPANDNYAYFNADDVRLPRRIRIPRLQLPDEFIRRPLLYSKTMLCFCRIKAWSTRYQSPMGEFVKTVGEYTEIETGISAILSKHNLQAHTLDFDSLILNELDEKYGTSGEKWKIPEEEFRKRRDFRETQIFSIDPYNARDLDDALHIRALNDARTKFEVGVHIADVTHFIEHNSLLDHEARSRCTSVYLTNRVLPMLPRVLCEKLCSLQPQVDRLAFSVVWQMNLDGTLVEGNEPWFGKSVIRSCCKLDYGSAQKMLDGDISGDNVDEWEEDRRPILGANPNITNATVVQSVKDLWSIGQNRRAMRFKTGAVSLNDVKLVFSLDAKGNPIRYGSYELKNSNRLVEEYMLLANYLVAQQLLRTHGPLAFLRHHPPPVMHSMDQTLEQLNKNDIKLDGRSTKQLTESLERVHQERGETAFAIVQALIIKPMKPAEYMVAGNGSSPASWRHYALNIPYYTHFTSPIRRYADVIVHRLLQESVEGVSSLHDEASDDVVTEARMVEFTSAAQNCNEKKMTAKNAEKECDKVFLCAFVQHHGDIEVTGIVLSTGQKSFTVYILELGLEERLYLQENRLTGMWTEKSSQLLVRLPASRKVKEGEEDFVGNPHENAVDNSEKGKVSAEPIELSFMKQLRMRMSTTKKMPLALTFSLLGEKK